MSRVAILTSVHDALDDRIFHKQARSLANAGYNVTLIGRHDKDETVEGVRIIGLPDPHNRLQRMTGLTFRVLRLALKEKADVYHFHDPELLPVGLLLKLFTRSRVIYDVHENYPESIRESDWLPPLIRNIVSGLFGVFEKICLPFLDAIVPATEDVSKRFRKTSELLRLRSSMPRKSPSKVVVVYNYPILDYAVRSEKVDPSVPREERVVIYTGGLSKDRGIGEIVRSLEYIDEKLQVRLKLLGWFTDPDFEEEVKALKVFSRVDFLGVVPHKEVYSHLASADIGLALLHPIPRYVTSMPIKMFEYMLSGLPVIASNFPLWKEILEGNNCGLTVNPLDPEEIANAIEFLLKRPLLMKEMGGNGRSAVLKKYSWEQEFKKLEELYVKILS